MEHYLNYGVDFDGDGQRQHAEELADALASAANYLKVDRLAGGRAVAAGSARAERPAVGAGRHHDQAAAVAVGGSGASPRPTASRCRPTARTHRCSCRWGGRSGVPRLPELRRLPRVEQLAGLFDDRRLSRDAARRARRKVHRGDRRRSAQRRRRSRRYRSCSPARGYDVGKIDGIIGARHAGGGQGHAAEVRPAGGFLSVDGAAAKLRTGWTPSTGPCRGAMRVPRP